MKGNPLRMIHPLCPQESSVNVPTQQSVTRSDIITLATLSFSAAIWLGVATIYVAKGDWLAWIDSAAALASVGAAIVVTRRILRKVP
jgi:hypothetical protein